MRRSGNALSSLTAAEALRAKIALAIDGLTAASGAVWNHPRLAELFPDFLCALHAGMRATEHSLRTAAECARARAAADPVAASIADYLARHADEERHHDDWLLEDIEALGLDRSAVLSRIPLPSIAALVGAQYYWMHHYHPVAFMGYIAVLEGRPPVKEYLEEVIQRTSLPRAAFRTYFIHATLDHHHVREFEETLNRLPLRPEHISVMGVSAITTVDLLRQVHEEVLDAFEDTRSARA